jgi:hypothetical protein
MGCVQIVLKAGHGGAALNTLLGPFPVVRLYFNQAGAKPWSLDTGVGTIEHCMAAVIIKHPVAKTVYDSETEDQVKAWIEFHDVCIQMLPAYAILLPEREKPQ